MSEWNKIVHQGVDTLDKAVEKFGAELIDKEALQPAFDNFQMRISPNVLFGDATLAILNPATRALGPVFFTQLQGAVLGSPLPFAGGFELSPGFAGVSAVTISGVRRRIDESLLTTIVTGCWLCRSLILISFLPASTSVIDPLIVWNEPLTISSGVKRLPSAFLVPSARS